MTKDGLKKLNSYKIEVILGFLLANFWINMYFCGKNIEI